MCSSNVASRLWSASGLQYIWPSLAVRLRLYLSIELGEDTARMDANSLYYDFSDEDTRQLLTTADNTIHVELGQEPWIIHIIDAIEKVRDAR